MLTFAEWFIIGNVIVLTSMIPEGSVLGPLLYVIYINDMPDLINKFAQVSLFADDAKICIYVATKQSEHDSAKTRQDNGEKRMQANASIAVSL